MSAPDRAGFADLFRSTQQVPAAQTIADFLADTAGLFAVTVANTLGEDYPETEDAPFMPNIFLMLANLRSAADNANAVLAARFPSALPEDPAP